MSSSHGFTMMSRYSHPVPPRRTPRALRAALWTALVVGAISVAPRPAQAQRGKYHTDSTFAFGRGGFVDLSVSSGDITVTGWTRPEARVIVISERGPAELQLSSGRITVAARRGGNVRIEVMVPVGSRVSATASSGDLRITGTNGEVEAQTSSGDVEVMDATDRVTISTMTGTIHAARIRGRLRINGTASDIDASEITGDIETHTVSGDVRMTRVTANQVRAETTSGDITYEGSMSASGSYEFQAHSGDVRLELPSNVSAGLQVQTYSGNITSRFPMTLQPGEQSASRRGKKMNFTIGSGGARVTVATFSGDITIERGGRASKED
jgi:DUF4097 and DUF4098 domain-containing protein YvlB